MHGTGVFGQTHVLLDVRVISLILLEMLFAFINVFLLRLHIILTIIYVLGILIVRHALDVHPRDLVIQNLRLILS